MKFLIVFLWFFVSIVSCGEAKKVRYAFDDDQEDSRCELVNTNSTKENITFGLFYRLTPVKAKNEDCKKVCRTYRGCEACFDGDIIPSCGRVGPDVKNWTLHYWSLKSQVYQVWNETSADKQTLDDYPFNNAPAPCTDFQFRQSTGNGTCSIKKKKMTIFSVGGVQTSSGFAGAMVFASMLGLVLLGIVVVIVWQFVEECRRCWKEW
jgi:hypothetical protein